MWTQESFLCAVGPLASDGGIMNVGEWASRETLTEKIQSVRGMQEVKQHSLGTHERPPPAFLLPNSSTGMMPAHNEKDYSLQGWYFQVGIRETRGCFEILAQQFNIMLKSFKDLTSILYFVPESYTHHYILFEVITLSSYFLHTKMRLTLFVETVCKWP